MGGGDLEVGGWKWEMGGTLEEREKRNTERVAYERVARVRACNSIEARSLTKLSKNRTLVHQSRVLSNINKMAYFYAACAVCVTIFSTGSKYSDQF